MIEFKKIEETLKKAEIDLSIGEYLVLYHNILEEASNQDLSHGETCEVERELDNQMVTFGLRCQERFLENDEHCEEPILELYFEYIETNDKCYEIE